MKRRSLLEIVTLVNGISIAVFLFVPTIAVSHSTAPSSLHPPTGRVVAKATGRAASRFVIKSLRCKTGSSPGSFLATLRREGDRTQISQFPSSTSIPCRARCPGVVSSPSPRPSSPHVRRRSIRGCRQAGSFRSLRTQATARRWPGSQQVSAP